MRASFLSISFMSCWLSYVTKLVKETFSLKYRASYVKSLGIMFKLLIT